MGGLFGGNKPPAPPPAPPVVTVNETRNAVEARDKLLRRRGFLATVLDDEAPSGNTLGSNSSTVLGGK